MGFAYIIPKHFGLTINVLSKMRKNPPQSADADCGGFLLCIIAARTSATHLYGNSYRSLLHQMHGFADPKHKRGTKYDDYPVFEAQTADIEEILQ